jgi:hypothetical protein
MRTNAVTNNAAGGKGRFWRTADIALLVDALNPCWSPHFPDERPMTPAAFKRIGSLSVAYIGSLKTVATKESGRAVEELWVYIAPLRTAKPENPA